MSQANPPNNWPPRSPHEVLLSTPGGRDRLRRLAERASPSPSPIKRPNSTCSFRDRTKQLLEADMDQEDGDDDEETLQLQLQEIQARLKLKKLQKRSKQSSDTEDGNGRVSSESLGRSNSVAAGHAPSRIAEIRGEKLQRSRSQASIHVPVSPVRRSRPIEQQRSPGRVLLGIDKGLKGSDVSLKRAPSLGKREESGFQDRRTGPFLQRASSQGSNRTTTSSLGMHNKDRPQSFSERMAIGRTQEAERQERELRIRKNRSAAFDIDYTQMESLKKTAVDLPDTPRAAPEFSRDEVLSSYNNPSGNLIRSKTAPNLRSAMKPTTMSTATVPDRPESQVASRVSTKKRASTVPNTQPSEDPESEATQFEPYSSTHLSKRIIPHQVLTRTLTGKKTFLIPDLLRVVKSPDFSLPEIEEDIVLFGIIAQKSEPRSHASNGKNQDRGKYMIIGLTDLKWELDFFLFDSGFEKFWKMTPGTIIAILNPGIMPPPRGKADTGKFSLTVNSEADIILEVGTARDLGFCKSIKKDGNACETWVDKRHTKFCDYHVNETLKKTHSARMEINTMNFGKDRYGAQKFNSKDTTGHFDYLRKKEEEKKIRYDRESHSQIFIGKKTTANLLDDVDFDPDAFHRGSTKEERVTRRLLAQEKERELARKLGAVGGGLGADYMRRKDKSKLDANVNSEMDLPPPPDASALGLLNGKAKDVALSPIKRKRTNTVSSSAAVGWGSDLSRKLGDMKNGESLQPVKKKTRFVTEKGIREAGRESFGGDMAKVVNELDEDDDGDLDIVRE